MAELKIIGSDAFSRDGLSIKPGAHSCLQEAAEAELVEAGAVTHAGLEELRQAVTRWCGLRVIAYYDLQIGSWVFIALHDMTLGPAVGGCRICTYPKPADAARDAMRLAEAMTRKWAVIDAEYGGGKSVISIPRPLEGAERAGLLKRFGHLLESLGGIYQTGEDLGTSPSDMAKMAEATRYVHGFDRATGRPLDPGPFTALGVLAGIKCSLQHFYNDAALRGRTILVQGLGHVGGPLARLLQREGARLILSDIRGERMKELAQELDCDWIEPEMAQATPCDVYAPCATGGMLSRESVSSLRCSVVAGAANNQLESAEVADLLHERAVLYAPDFVINAGGAISLPLLHKGMSEREARERVQSIAQTLGQIFEEAASLNESPLHAAERRAARVLARARTLRAPLDTSTFAPAAKDS
ncbi:MAG TPA: Glu/Leu/Phe/Val dehydrogenase dimerization domain-containing protein [Pyrinomonadaceae bacterium]|nr:Glu/Leu/Phe/Val dehydrogenase dimerization domain-containing protein [Pyrinomonadaceae bacterium]